jgi:hypothetical protein
MHDCLKGNWHAVCLMLPESSQCSAETAAKQPALFIVTRNTQIGRQQADRDRNQKTHTVRRHKKYQIGTQQM